MGAVSSRTLRRVTAALIAVSALAACRKEVPLPPVPAPDKEPKPVTRAAQPVPRDQEERAASAALTSLGRAPRSMA